MIRDNPAVLCAKLAAKALDVALVSSFELLRHPLYRVVADISISSEGPVYSVVVAHRREISTLDKIELDPASETSAALLRCLLAERGLNPRLVSRSALSVPDAGRLLIGDQAVHFRQDHPEFRYWDLGDEWNKFIGLPFVYALWLIRPEVAEARTVANKLRAIRDRNMANIDELMAAETDFDPNFCKRYYRDHLRFNFGEKEKEGLRAFQRLCEKHGLLPKREIELSVV